MATDTDDISRKITAQTQYKKDHYYWKYLEALENGEVDSGAFEPLTGVEQGVQTGMDEPSSPARTSITTHHRLSPKNFDHRNSGKNMNRETRNADGRSSSVLNHRYTDESIPIAEENRQLLTYD